MRCSQECDRGKVYREDRRPDGSLRATWSSPCEHCNGTGQEPENVGQQSVFDQG